MPYIKLHGHYTKQSPCGLDIGTIDQTIPLGDGTTVELPIPFVPINQDLAIAPVIKAEGEAAARIDFRRWSPMRYGEAGLALFPYDFVHQEDAVRMARAFDADPATGWDDGYEEKVLWLRAWSAAEGRTIR